MVLVIVLTKEGIFKNENVDENLDELYKCCKYKSNKDFTKLHEWGKYELWGKLKGKNSHELLKKIINENRLNDLVLLGNVCICKNNEDLTLKEWNKFYQETKDITSKQDNVSEYIELEELEEESYI